MTLEEDAINLHRMLKGKIEIHSRVSIDGSSEGRNNILDLIYTPGVASVARKTIRDKTKNWYMTLHQNGTMLQLFVTEHEYWIR